MGLLRLTLAVVVFISHFANIQKFDTFISGALAVRIFYLISGFYIQFIISQYDDQERWRKKFYLSRLLRLFPAYYIILILTVWLNGTTCNSFCTSMVINNATSSLIFYYSTNLFIMGQQLGKFLTYHYSTGGFSFDPNVARPAYWVSNMQVLGQSWSLCLELWFYLLAPYILKRRSRDLIVIALVSFATKFSLALHGYDNINTWYNAFFPSEIHTFLLGALAARMVLDRTRLKMLQKYLGSFGMMFLMVWTGNKSLFPGDPDELFVWGVFCFLPFLFLATQHSRIDKWIGSLSYPIYLNHLLAINFLKQYTFAPVPLLISSMVLSFIMSALIVMLIENPLSRFRHRKYRTALPEPAPLRQTLRTFSAASPAHTAEAI
jgi:peptidoglycan/LPS O-acetylase OafA/YrhL